MRKLLLPFLIFIIACGCKNARTDKKNESTDYLVSLEGIGPVKTEMSQDELEKLLNKKIPLTNPRDTISGSWMDSAFIKYKEADLRLTFVRTYAYSATDSFTMRMTDMQTSSPLCKTKDGIGIGANKQQIVDAFEDHILIMEPGYADTTYTTRSKTHYTIKVREDWEGRELVFYLKDNKVYAIRVGSFYDDSE
ncbi:MAG: hypothetical protein HOP10_01790 [Chitinophagaceae bacterium]|nr:hypothetical protein [Chitinophagaceae bacterium]